METIRYVILFLILAYFSSGLGQTSFAESFLNIESAEIPVNMETAKAVCGDIKVVTIDHLLACKRCPEFTTYFEQSEPLILKAMVQGNFNSPEDRQTIVDTDGCESRSELYGGIAILQGYGKTLSRLNYQSGFRLNDCLKFRSSNDTDILVCNEQDHAQGHLFGQFSVFRFRDNTASSEVLQHWFVQEDKELVIQPIAIEQGDINGDNFVDLTLQFSIQVDDSAAKTTTLAFLFNGQSFEIEAKHQEIKAILDEILKPYFEDETENGE